MSIIHYGVAALRVIGNGKGLLPYSIQINRIVRCAFRADAYFFFVSIEDSVRCLPSHERITLAGLFIGRKSCRLPIGKYLHGHLSGYLGSLRGITVVNNCVFPGNPLGIDMDFSCGLCRNFRYFGLIVLRSIPAAEGLALFPCCRFL